MAGLIKQKLGVVNVGLAQFAETISAAGGAVTQLAWTPPALGDIAAGMALARLTNHPEVELANEQAFAAFLAASPRLRSVGTAATTLSGLGERTILHAGPPVEWTLDEVIPVPMDYAGADLGWHVKEDSGRGWRRVVPSPPPKAIVDRDVISHLVNAGYVVIACGGGGIPVIENGDGTIRGIEAVIDKDFASSLLARKLGADRFVVATGVERVALDFGKPTQRWFDRLILQQAKQLYDADQFDKGSMGPKVRAVIEFLEGGGAEGIITDSPHLEPALAGKGGTRIVPS